MEAKTAVSEADPRYRRLSANPDGASKIKKTIMKPYKDSNELLESIKNSEKGNLNKFEWLKLQLIRAHHLTQGQIDKAMADYDTESLD